jgi:hypothetical protein
MMSPTSGIAPKMNGHFFAPTLRMQMVWDVLETAKDNDDQIMIAACRRLVVADRLGWKKHAELGDIELVMSFAN